MSLKVWLPLNGNLKNQGLSSATIIASGAEAVSGGKLGGQTYSFDGTDDYISIDSSSLYDCFKGGEYPFTIAMWIYFNETTGERGVLFGDYNLSGAINFNLEINSDSNWNNDIRFYWAGSPDYRATDTAITSNTWVHLAVTYSGTQLKFYKNGILINTRDGTLSSKNKASGAFYLGRDSRTGATAFNGKLNDVRIYDECLSDKEIKEIYKTLILHYKLDNSAKVTDCSGYQRNATIINLLKYNKDTALNNGSIYFYGNSTYIAVPTINFTDFSDNFTISWWAQKPSNSMSGKMAWGFKDGNRLNVYPTSSVFCCNTGDGAQNPYKNGNTSVAFSTYDNGQWHHYAMVADGISNKLYIDGVYKGTALTFKGITGTQIIISGWDTGTNYKWTGGSLSDFRIYATVLTDNDIKELGKTKLIIDNKQNLYSYDFSESNYAELDYLEATGTQYIVTDIPMKNIRRISWKFQYTDLTINQGLFGWQEISTQPIKFVVRAGDSSTSRFGMYVYNSGNLVSANTSINIAETDLISRYWVLNDSSRNLGSGSSDNMTSSNTIPIFALRNDNAASGFKDFSKVKLYYIRFYDKNGQTLGDFVPALDLNNIACLYDKITQHFYYNQGTGDFSYGNIVKDTRNKFKIQKNGVLENQEFEECNIVLPTGYKRLEYIEGTGTQYIDTNYKPYKTTTELRFQYPSTPDNGLTLCGVYNASNNRYYVLFYSTSTGISCSDRSNVTTSLKNPIDNNIHTIIYNDSNNKVFFDGIEKCTVSNLTKQSAYPLYLFARRGSNVAEVISLGRIYYCKIWEEKTLVRNFIPVEDNNGVACLYDIVSKTSFYNQGTGNFIKGNYTTNKVQLYNNKVISNNFYEI